MRRVLSLLILTSIVVWSQTTPLRWSANTGIVTVSGTTYTATIQQPTSGAKSVGFEQAIVYCSVACTFTQSQNGTAATGTAGTVQPITPYVGSPVTTFWTASNVGSGTAVGGTTELPAGATWSVDLSKVTLPAAGATTAVNYSISFASLTGNVSVTFFGSER